jgi:hypothetical protein
MRLLIVFLGILFSLSSCDTSGGDDGSDPSAPLVYVSLTADRDTISPGEATRITAVATGYRLTYTWTKSAGIITGTGYQVSYTVPPCDLGRNRITCKVTDGHNVSQTKEIYLVAE